VIDERPDEIKQLEVFRTSKWKVLGGKTLTSCACVGFICLRKHLGFYFIFLILEMNRTAVENSICYAHHQIKVEQTCVMK